MKNIELRGQRAELIKNATAIVDATQKRSFIDWRRKVKIRRNGNRCEKHQKTKSTHLERATDLKKELASNAEARQKAPKASKKGAFEKYLRNGMGALNNEERALMGEMRGTSTQVVGTDSLGGFLVPQDFSDELDIATLFTGEVERIAEKLNTAGGALLDYPTINDTATDANLNQKQQQ